MEKFRDKYLSEPIENGIVLRRENGEVCTNVPHLITYHSSTGFEFGYGGSGPADLALNICEMILRRLKYNGEINERCGCFEKSLEIYQEFKWEFIATASDGNVIQYDEVVQWFKRRLAE